MQYTESSIKYDILSILFLFLNKEFNNYDTINGHLL